MKQNNRHMPHSFRQHGVALVVALVLLVVVTLVGLAAIRGTGLQEKMAGNAFDRAQAFQLSEAIQDLTTRTVVLANPGPTPQNCGNAGNGGCQPGITDCTSAPCEENPATDTTHSYPWVQFPIDSTASGAANVNSLVSVYGNTPDYLVQYMGQCTNTGGGKFKFTNDENNTGGGGSLVVTSQCYRITTRDGAAAGRSQIVLQAIYRVS
jgi:type IV pilus assembly protein PilX